MDLTSSSGIELYLKSRNVINLDSDETYQYEELTGGTANFVWRLTSSTGSTSIIKHAEGYIRNHPDFKFSQERMNFEAAALSKLGDILEEDDVVAPAKFFGYDPEAHILHISDGGSQHLKDAYSSNSELDVQEAGRRLGQWICRLHASTTTLDIGDATVAKTIYRHSYNGLSGALKTNGLDEKLGEKINEEYGSLLAVDDQNVCHGDFWTGNILVQTNPLRLTVVDWEMTRRGNGSTDVGQFAAEAWLLDRFRGGKGLLKAFLSAVRKAKGAEWKMEDRVRVAVHFGTHIAFWPNGVQWGSKEETKEVVEYGSEVLQKATEHNYEWLSKSALGPLFS